MQALTEQKHHRAPGRAVAVWKHHVHPSWEGVAVQRGHVGGALSNTPTGTGDTHGVPPGRPQAREEAPRTRATLHGTPRAPRLPTARP